MKTPKRIRAYVSQFATSQDCKNARARYKRKNRVKQLKRTIARLTTEFRKYVREYHALWIGEHLKRFSPEWDAFILLRKLQTPAEDATLDEKFEYWVALREVGKSVLNAACLAAMAYGEAKGKEEEKTRACHAQNAENAKQEGLPCADAEQLETIINPKKANNS